MKKIITCSAALLFFLALSSCGEEGKKSETKALPPSQAPAGSIQGIVKETVNASGYTYVLVKTADKEVWAAAPATSVQQGDTIIVPSGMSMPGYHSKTLDRTFDSVRFVSSLSKKGAQMNANPHDSHESLDAHESHGSNEQKFPADIGKSHTTVQKAAKITGITVPSGGKTLSQIFTEKEKLFGKQVFFRAKVVKATAKVMGTNWYHFQDGTGEEGSNDLTVTSDAEAKVGQVATVKGILVKDKDFGSGYKYPVIIEKAQITVE